MGYEPYRAPTNEEMERFRAGRRLGESHGMTKANGWWFSTPGWSKCIIERYVPDTRWWIKWMNVSRKVVNVESYSWESAIAEALVQNGGK